MFSSYAPKRLSEAEFKTFGSPGYLRIFLKKFTVSNLGKERPSMVRSMKLWRTLAWQGWFTGKNNLKDPILIFFPMSKMFFVPIFVSDGNFKISIFLTQIELYKFWKYRSWNNVQSNNPRTVIFMSGRKPIGNFFLDKDGRASHLFKSCDIETLLNTSQFIPNTIYKRLENSPKKLCTLIG